MADRLNTADITLISLIRNSLKGDNTMPITKVFTNARGQAVIIPKEYRFDTDEVFISRIGNTVLLTHIEDLPATFEHGAALLTEDFLPKGDET